MSDDIDDLVAECIVAMETEGPLAVERLAAAHPERSAALRERLARLESMGLLPVRIGAYRVVAEIGRGGMGAVYRAEQDEPVRRTVAIKVIKLGLDTQETLARFELERRTLERMEHPNIARLFDAGTTSEGRPFFVMEFVAGAPITDYCDEHSLDLAARLVLFMKVCDAVQHAHQKGVIHRDLKPSNILVAARGEFGAEPKIIDFGIAKAIDPGAAGAAGRTVRGELIGTPEYMSPEQAAIDSAAIDTRSDVYSLGVLLYELLTGRLPFEPARLRAAGFDEMRRILRDEPPPRASTRIHGAGAEGSARDRARTTAMRRVLRDDLDWILQKALAKEPELRYQSPLELADDLRRHLRHEPVAAGPPGTIYRLRKLIQRHRAGFLASVAVAGSIVVGFVVSTVLYLEARAAQRDEAAARAIAEDRAREAEEVAGFLDDLFRYASPTHPDRGATPVREVFAQAAARVRREFPNRPLVRAQLEARIGKVYYWLGSYDDSRELLEEAIALRYPLVADGDDTLRVWRLDLALTLQSLGRFRDAEAMLTTLLAAWVDDPTARRLRAQAQSALGLVQHDQGRDSAAEHNLSDAVAALRQLDRAGGTALATALDHLAGFLHDTGRDAEALAGFEESVALRRAANPEGHPAIPVTLQNLCRCLTALGRFDRAERTALEAIADAERIYGGRHPDLATVLVAHAQLLSRLGRATECEAQLRRALAIREAALDPDHPDVAWSLNDLGCRLIAGDRYRDAAPLLSRACAAYRKVHGGDHVSVAICLANLAHALAEIGELDRAEDAARESLAMHERFANPVAGQMAHAWNALASVLRARGRSAEAIAAVRHAIELWRTAPGAEWDAGWGHVRLAFFENMAGDPAAAEANGRKGLALLRAASPIDHHYIANGLLQVACAVQARGQIHEAEELLRESTAMYRRIAPQGNAILAFALDRLAGVLLPDRPDEAIELYRECSEMRESLSGRADESTLGARHNLGAALARAGRDAEARACIDGVLALEDEHLDHPHALRDATLFEAARLRERMGDVDGAAVAAERCLAERRALARGDDAGVAAAMSLVGHLLARRERDREAEQLLLDADRILTAAGGAALIQNLGRLCALYERLGDQRRAALFRARIAAEKERSGSGRRH